MINLFGESGVEDRLIAERRVHNRKEREAIEGLEIVLIARACHYGVGVVQSHTEQIILDADGIGRLLQNNRSPCLLFVDRRVIVAPAVPKDGDRAAVAGQFLLELHEF